MGLAEKVLQGNVQAAARLITAIENDSPGASDELDIIYPKTGKAFIIGITGPPGIGKSTIIDAMIGLYRKRGMTVGVIAVDPTSPFTGGAILGDRIRMQHHSSDSGVFIRSLATRGWLGGLARAAMSTVHVLDALGKDIIIIETVGTGQSEVDIARVADSTIVMLAAGAGDEIQIMKAGIMEIADIFAINKADRGGAEDVAAEIEMMLHMKNYTSTQWKPSVVLSEAISGKGIEKLIEEIQRHKDFLAANGGLGKTRRERAKQELMATCENYMRDFFCQGTESYLEHLVDAFADRKESPRSSALKIVDLFSKQFGQPEAGATNKEARKWTST